MGKRKRRDYDYDDILRKIRKIASKRNRRRYKTPSEDSESDQYEYEGEHSASVHENPDEAVVTNELLDLTDLPPEPSTSAVPVTPSAPPASVARRASVAAPTEGTPLTQAGPHEPPGVDSENVPAKPPEDDNIPPLEPEILELLGEDPTSEKKCGQKLHRDIASRWSHILTNGLTKDTQLELVKLYLPPENCPNMRVPKLNLEIKAALLESNIKKDLYSQSKQNQLSSSLAAIGQVLNWALGSKSVPQDIIKTLSDAGRLICDSHYKESQSRRFAALNTLNKDIRDTVKNTRIDEHLFGSALADHIKSSKAIIKTGSEMKAVTQRPPYRTTAVATQPQRGTLNYRGAPPRVAAAAEPRLPPAPRRPRRDRRQEAPRGRRPTSHARHPAKRRY